MGRSLPPAPPHPLHPALLRPAPPPAVHPSSPCSLPRGSRAGPGGAVPPHAPWTSDLRAVALLAVQDTPRTHQGPRLRGKLAPLRTWTTLLAYVRGPLNRLPIFANARGPVLVFRWRDEPPRRHPRRRLHERHLLWDPEKKGARGPVRLQPGGCGRRRRHRDAAEPGGAPASAPRHAQVPDGARHEGARARGGLQRGVQRPAPPAAHAAARQEALQDRDPPPGYLLHCLPQPCAGSMTHARRPAADVLRGLRRGRRRLHVLGRLGASPALPPVVPRSASADARTYLGERYAACCDHRTRNPTRRRHFSLRFYTI